jgi:hypothetical protein
MKIRNGFVSNSSASSFCIYGTVLTTDIIGILVEIKKHSPNIFLKIQEELRKTYKDRSIADDQEYKDYINNALKWIDDMENNDPPDELLCEVDVQDIISTALGDNFEVIVPPEWDSIYVGRSWKDIGDKETGAKFKKNIEEQLTKIFGKVSFDTHEEAWNG